MFLFLIGMPGSGKTFWSKHLAKKNGFLAIDLDEEIEKHCQATIPELFKISEAYFREREKEVLKKIIAETKEDAVIATGGGTPCFQDNLAKMKAVGKVIYLKSELDSLMHRLLRSSSERPLLPKSASLLKEKLQIVEGERKVFYEQADMVITVEQLTLDAFDKLLKAEMRLEG